MTELLIGVVLILLLLRALANGDGIELDDLLGIPQFLAMSLVASLAVVAFFFNRGGDESGTRSTLSMLGVAASGLLIILFPERMPDTTRGGTLMTAFWSVFGWLLIALAYAVVLIA